ncbi:GntR family transcriptional regulator [Dongia sp.]|uniref:GntR family transcriptional regulator n=1 Tax=Dongia sp. TaxID=1977262 RepID=UPI0035ADEA01
MDVKVPEEVVGQIKQEIMFGRLRPRERLVEDELATKFGANRHQIRAAFTELERIGLVTRRPNKGVIVRDFSVEEVEQFFEVGALLQAEAVKRIPLPLEPVTLRILEGIHRSYCAAIDRVDLEQVSADTIEFHRVIYGASNNKCLSDLIEQIWTMTLAIRCYAMAIPELLDRARQEHSQILEALRKGNRRELLRLCVDHSWPALEAYKRLHGGWASKSMANQSAMPEEATGLKRRKAK